MKPINIKDNRVMRGGTWGYLARYCHVAARFGYAPYFRGDFLRFLFSIRFVKGRKR